VGSSSGKSAIYDFNIRDYPQFVEKLRYIHPQSGGSAIDRASARVALEQLSPLRYRGGNSRQD
jgi:hypothetical protein